MAASTRHLETQRDLVAAEARSVPPRYRPGKLRQLKRIEDTLDRRGVPREPRRRSRPLVLCILGGGGVK